MYYLKEFSGFLDRYQILMISMIEFLEMIHGFGKTSFQIILTMYQSILHFTKSFLDRMQW